MSSVGIARLFSFLIGADKMEKDTKVVPAIKPFQVIHPKASEGKDEKAARHNFKLFQALISM